MFLVMCFGLGCCTNQKQLLVRTLALTKHGLLSDQVDTTSRGFEFEKGILYARQIGCRLFSIVLRRRGRGR